ncbi:helix-turn-helix transcriptional regulator [Nonomuraea sp. NEAU-A123]|nr:helix-turn-helix transcriptional regulator [Nonomuraea sp. NEAU-A123]
MTSEQHSGGGTELGCFLRARRTQVTPEEAGLKVGPGLRRTPGLRREELATLAGVSIDYYIRLERGKEARPGRHRPGRPRPGRTHRRAHAQEPGVRAPVGALRRQGALPRPQDLPPPRRRRPHARLPVHAARGHPGAPPGRVLRRTRYP